MSSHRQLTSAERRAIRAARTPLVGSKRLPLHRAPDTSRHAGQLCADQAGLIPHAVGTYVRVCHTCGLTFVAEVTEAEWATEHCARRTLIVHWHVADVPNQKGASHGS